MRHLRTHLAGALPAVVAALLLALAAPGPADARRVPGVARGAPVVAESATGRYVVVMAVEPLVATEGRGAIGTLEARQRAQELTADQDDALASVGVAPERKTHTYTVALSGFSVPLDHDQAQRLASRRDVALVAPDELQQPHTDASPEFLGVSGRGGLAHEIGVDGEGVVVGVIDTGIWPEHPSFADTGDLPDPDVELSDVGVDGEPSDPCDFGNTDANDGDDDFRCNDKLVGARQMLATYRSVVGLEDWEFDSARDDDGHGTHAASTAAGNAGVDADLQGMDVGAVSGIAPRAQVIAYKGLGARGGFTSDLTAAIDQAVADGVDVINYSVGGGASLTGPDDIAFLFAAEAGVHVATSAGNSGPDPDTVGGPANVPWVTTVGASTQRRLFSGTVRTGDGSSYEGVSVTLPMAAPAPLRDAADLGNELCAPGEFPDPSQVEGAVVLCTRGEVARVAKSQAVAEAGGVGMILFEAELFGDRLTDPHLVPAVHVDNATGLALRAYLRTSPDPTAQIVDTARKVDDEQAPAMAAFSSRGPNPQPDVIKPDLTAPGAQILAGHTPAPAPDLVQGELFQAISGTSMSSPHVAGVLALLDQVHPDWSPAMARSALMTTADPGVVDNDLSQATPFEMGAGHLDPGPPRSRGSAFQPGLVYDAGLVDYFGFLCSQGPEIFVDAAATCAAVEAAGVSTDPSDLNYPSIGIADLAGTQTITRTVTSVEASPGARTYRAEVDAPAGFDVTVSPSRIRLRAGQSASFEVTITRTDAEIGAWGFGTLTWVGAGDRVRSPIAVRAARFAAPDEVQESGTSGSGSFEVQMGYTGDYTAAAHGPVGVDLREGTVAQDPDQTFDPSDVDSGGAVAHTFDLQGAAHLRLALPPDSVPEPDADLDLFLYDPSGTQVASSTAGATDERIDVTLPADGTWTAYVHGWQTVTDTIDYALSSWVVSATPGGVLTIDQAPTSATLGRRETISYSWSDLDEGVDHLGAISHADDSGLIGLTLVNVATDESAAGP